MSKSPSQERCEAELRTVARRMGWSHAGRDVAAAFAEVARDLQSVHEAEERTND